ncbi:MAG: hypothetical protein HC883_03240 [Bdellovibrionaceae bacterium]|nr:hypothetical protein [Pseudobdellovibrionaceae bacterium]
MKNISALTALFVSTLLLAACSGKRGGSNNTAAVTPTPGPSELQGLVKGTAYIPVIVGQHGQIQPMAAHKFPVTVVNPPNVVFDINTDATVMPVISNSMLDFGKIAVSSLTDNDLRVCGANGNKKCAQAFIRIYTTGTPGAGAWNSEGGYGMPIYSNQTGSAPLTVGLDAANAAVVQTIKIPNNKHVLRLSDFPNPAYELRADFTEAGAGSYSTTLVIEYGLLD